MKSMKHKQIIPLALGLIVVLIASGLYITHHYQLWPFLPAKVQPSTTDSVNYDSPTTDELTTGTATKQAAVDNTSSSSSSSNNSHSSQTQPINVSFTAVQPGQTVYIRTLIDLVSSEGSCSLHMQGPGQKNYDATALTQALATNSTCQGFNIPMTSLESGKWTITVTVTDGNRTGSATTEETL